MNKKASDIRHTDSRPLAFITGGGSGIGRAIAISLASKGWQVIISGRSQEKLLSVGNHHHRLHTLQMDVTDLEMVKESVTSIFNRYGVPDLAILNAGDYKPMPADDLDIDLVHHLNNVNYLGVMNTLASLLPGMRQKKQGQIMIMSSVSGYRGLPDAAPYGATKAALINFAESLYMPLRREGILLRVINPGFIKTGLTDQNNFTMPALISPEEAAERIISKLKDDNFEITFPRRFTYVLKILRCLPYRIYFPLTARLTGK